MLTLFYHTFSYIIVKRLNISKWNGYFGQTGLNKCALKHHKVQKKFKNNLNTRPKMSPPDTKCPNASHMVCFSVLQLFILILMVTFQTSPSKCVNSSAGPDRRHLPLSSLSPALHAPGGTSYLDAHKITWWNKKKCASKHLL